MNAKRTALLALSFGVASIALLGLFAALGARIAVHAAPSLAPLRRPHSPSSGFYTMYDTLTPADVPTATYAWVEIRDDYDYRWDLGGRYSGSGDTSAPVPIGFFFPFYRDFYTHFRISEKGYIFFEKEGVNVGSGRGRPDLIPSNNLTGTDAANNFIAPFADDLYGYPGISHVYVRTDTSPRRTIIEFENLVWCCGLYNPRTFEIILYPSGAIEMQYRKITNFSGPLDEALKKTVIVGLENLDGSAGDVYTQGLFIPTATEFWQDGMAIRFEPNFTATQAVFFPAHAAIWDDPGRLITTTANLYLGAGEDIMRSFRLTYTLAVSSNVPAAVWAENIACPLAVAAISGTYSTTLQFVVGIPVSVTDVNDTAIVTFTAESTDYPPYISATFTLTYGPAWRDLQITKRLDPAIAPAQGGALRYQLVVTNTDYAASGRAAVAHGVVVTDLLPPGVEYEDCRIVYDWADCGGMVTTDTLGSQTVVTLDLGTLGVDEVERIWIEARNYNASGTFNNTAHVTTTTDVELGDGPNNHASAQFTVAAAASELSVRKHYPYSYVAAGQAVPFDIYFYNDGSRGHTGNSVRYGVMLTDLLPDGTSFAWATLDYAGPELVPGAEGPITPAIGAPLSRTLVFTIPFADNGYWNEAHLRLWVNIPSTIPLGTRLTNTVTISDGISSDSDIEVVTVASSYVDPFVDKEPLRDQAGYIIAPEPGMDYTYWITYGNRSMLIPATGVMLTDTLPLSVTLVSASPTPYLTGPLTSTLPDGRVQLTWLPTGEDIPPGWVGQIVVIVHIGSDVPRGTQIVNQIVITYTGEYAPATTLDDTDIVTVEIASDLEGSRKSVRNATPAAGETVEYSIVLSNASLSQVMPFTVSDVLPVGLLAYAGHDAPMTGTVSAGNNAILWTGQILTNAEVTLTFRAVVTEVAYAGQVIRNTAVIASSDLVLLRHADVTVAHSVWSGSGKTPSIARVSGGGTFSYTVTVSNSGSLSRPVTITDRLPPSLTLVSDSLAPSAGSVITSSDGRTITWTVSTGGQSSEQLAFRVAVMQGLEEGTIIENVAYLDDGYAPQPLALRAIVTIGRFYPLYLPLVMRQ